MVLVLLPLFLSVGYADDNNASVKSLLSSDSTWDDDIEATLKEIDDITKEIEQNYKEAERNRKEAEQNYKEADAYNRIGEAWDL